LEMRRLLILAVLLLFPALCSAQYPGNYELLCPSGSVPMAGPTGTTFNPSTGKYKAVTCTDSFGNISENITGALLAANTLTTSTRPFVDPTHPTYGALCDGSHNDALALQAAATAAAGGTLFIPGQCVTGSTISLPSNIHVLCNATATYSGGTSGGKIKFTGTGDAIFIGNQKYVTWDGCDVDISGSGAGSNAFHIAGLWFSSFTDFGIDMGGTSSNAGMLIESSKSGTSGFGTYVMKIFPRHIFGSGTYGIRFQRQASPADNVSNTHVDIIGGWLQTQNNCISIDRLSTSTIIDTTCEGGSGDAFAFSNSNDIKFLPGEIDGYGGYCFNPTGTNNIRISIIEPTKSGTNCTTGFINTTNYTPDKIGNGELFINSPGAASNFNSQIISNFNSSDAWDVNVQGGGSVINLFKWNPAASLTIDPGAGNAIISARQHNFNAGLVIGPSSTVSGLPACTGQ